MDIEAIKIFKIELDQDAIASIEIEEYGADFNNYLKGLIEIINESNKGRNFNFERDTTEVRVLINRINAGEEFGGIASIVAKRLLVKEKEAQEKIAQLGIEIQKGIMIIGMVNESGIRKFVICKADHNDFLNDTSFTLSRGLPIKKKIFKAFVTTFNDDNSINNVVVFDSNPSMSHYWWKDFLELSEIYDDKHNTKTAFEALDHAIFNKIKNDHPQDYVYLRNSTVRYFRANSAFEMNDYLDNGIGDYQPFDPALNIVELKNKIRKLPETKKFDNQFNILRDQVKAKFINRIPLTTQIDLVLKEDIINLENVISAEEEADGTKYVKIRSDSGYKYFKERR